jgi:signal peptidase II
MVKRLLIILLVSVSCIGCDQVSKVVARHTLPQAGVIKLLGDTIRLEYTENPGAFLSFGADISEEVRFWVFLILNAVLLTGILIYLILSKQLSTGQTVALSFVLGGGLGNLTDRIFNDGRVIDFMNLGIGSLRTGIFNVADVAITIGVILLLGQSIRGKGKRSVASRHPQEGGS